MKYWLKSHTHTQKKKFVHSAFFVLWLFIYLLLLIIIKKSGNLLLDWLELGQDEYEKDGFIVDEVEEDPEEEEVEERVVQEKQKRKKRRSIFTLLISCLYIEDSV